MTIAFLGLKVKVKVNPNPNAVSLTSILNRGLFSSDLLFSSVFVLNYSCQSYGEDTRAVDCVGWSHVGLPQLSVNVCQWAGAAQTTDTSSGSLSVCWYQYVLLDDDTGS